MYSKVDVKSLTSQHRWIGLRLHCVRLPETSQPSAWLPGGYRSSRQRLLKPQHSHQVLRLRDATSAAPTGACSTPRDALPGLLPDIAAMIINKLTRRCARVFNRLLLPLYPRAEAARGTWSSAGIAAGSTVIVISASGGWQ
jgi:hypothetical protein